MKRLLTTAVTIFAVLALAVPAHAVKIATGEEAHNNAQRGISNVDWSWTEIMQHSGQEASKFNTAGEQVLGAFVGGIIGVRHGIHRLGAGAIDLLTFWIPKDGTLVKDDMLK